MKSHKCNHVIFSFSTSKSFVIRAPCNDFFFNVRTGGPCTKNMLLEKEKLFNAVSIAVCKVVFIDVGL